MLLGDSDIKKLISDGVLRGAEQGNVGPVSYDLRTHSFYKDNKRLGEITLNPGDSAFVSSIEDIYLPNDIAARVLIKNSRLRQGLTLDAPLYFPGHKTKVFFRITNVSSDSIDLDTGKGIAQIAFEQVDKVQKPYQGAFSDEFDFQGLGDYSNIYKDEIKELEQKKDELKSMERRVYANTLTLMAVFAAIFTLVNINANALSVGSAGMVVINLMVLGGFFSFAGVIGLIVGESSSRVRSGIVLGIGLALVLFGGLLSLLPSACFA